jgi:glycosyltransferase involved in cell wall biosynthesis
MLSNPLISVVIATKNEEKNLERCLNSIKNQTYKNFEIIVIDNFSIDQTLKIAQKYTKKIFQIGPERSRQRNYGFLEMSSGEYGLYIDADMILAPNLFKQFVANINEGISGYFIEEIILGDSIFSKVRRFERLFYNATAIDAVRFFPLNNFREVGGFDEELFVIGSGEDWELDIKLSLIGKLQLIPKLLEQKENIKYFKKMYPVVFDKLPKKFLQLDAVLFHNESDLTLYNYLKKKRYYTEGFEGYRKKWGNNNPFIKKQFGFSYRYFKVFIENGKWKMSLKRPHLFLAFLIYKFLVGLVYLEGKIRRGWNEKCKDFPNP